MRSIVSLLDEQHRAAVAELWAELDSKFVKQGFCPTPYPHLSFHVAESYDLAALKPALKGLTSSSHPIKISTSGLGVFTGREHPVIYLTVVRDAALSEFHRGVWEAVEGTYEGVNLHYEPSNWIPHITLMQGEILTQHLPQIVDLLWRRDFHWEIEMASLSLIYDDDGRQGVEMSFDLAPTARNTRGAK